MIGLPSHRIEWSSLESPEGGSGGEGARSEHWIPLRESGGQGVRARARGGGGVRAALALNPGRT